MLESDMQKAKDIADTCYYFFLDMAEETAKARGVDDIDAFVNLVLIELKKNLEVE